MTRISPGAARTRSARARIAGASLVAAALFSACTGSSGIPATTAPGGGASPGAGGSVVSVGAPGGASSDPVGVAPGATPSTRPTPGPTVPRVPTLQSPAHVSRVAMPGIGIDLPVISGDVQPPPSYPFCDVAAYVTRFNQPYETGVTYISAHAQKGMFLPLLQSERADDGQDLIGHEIDVYTSDGGMFVYKVDQIVEHATDYSIINSIPLNQHELILQTSEGPYGTIEKMQVVASLQSQTTVALQDANPVPHPRDCEPSPTQDPSAPTDPAASATP